jgi:hypothetical protein
MAYLMALCSLSVTAYQTITKPAQLQERDPIADRPDFIGYIFVSAKSSVLYVHMISSAKFY